MFNVNNVSGYSFMREIIWYALENGKNRGAMLSSPVQTIAGEKMCKQLILLRGKWINGREIVQVKVKGR